MNIYPCVFVYTEKKNLDPDQKRTFISALAELRNLLIQKIRTPNSELTFNLVISIAILKLHEKRPVLTLSPMGVFWTDI